MTATYVQLMSMDRLLCGNSRIETDATFETAYGCVIAASCRFRGLEKPLTDYKAGAGFIAICVWWMLHDQNVLCNASCASHAQMFHFSIVCAFSSHVHLPLTIAMLWIASKRFARLYHSLRFVDLLAPKPQVLLLCVYFFTCTADCDIARFLYHSVKHTSKWS